MTLNDWIRSSRIKAGLTQLQLGKALGVGKANVSSWELGKHEPSHTQISRISAITGEPIPQAEGSLEVLGLRRIPELDFVQAGQWAVMCKNRDVLTTPFITVEAKLSENAFAIRVRGDEMYPVFLQGDYLIVDPEAPLKNDGYVVAAVRGQEAIFRQYRVRGQDKQGKPAFDLHALNSSLYSDIRSDQVPVEIIGRVVRVSRELK